MQSFPRLLEPLGEMVLGVEVVNDQANPAGGQHEDGGDNLSDKGNRFLDDVDDGEDGKDDADDVDDGTHAVDC